MAFQPPPSAAVPPTPTPVQVASAPPVLAASQPAPPVHAPAEAPAPPMAAADIVPALTGVLGSKAVQALLQTDDFAHRVVATVDNLGRDSAPSRLWPAQPTPGRFTVDERDGGPVIGADNALRYTAFVLMVESVDTQRLVDLYRRMAPLLQQAYEDLGYPHRRFDDRLLEVIDQLLATPEAAYPVRLTLTDVKGPYPSVRPWVRYEFADPRLESLSSGQKILLRVGAVNERRLKSRLRALRQQLAGGAASPGLH